MMKPQFPRKIAVLAALGFCVCPVLARPLVPRPAGQVQLAGDNGRLGQLYTLGTRNKFNVAVQKLSYTLVGKTFGTSFVGANEGEKLLRLDMLAHNPNPRAVQFWRGTLRISAIGSDNNTYRALYLGNPNVAHAETSTRMLPAQRVPFFALIPLPSNVTVQRVVIQHQTETPVLRLPIRGANIIQKLPAPFAAATGNGAVVASPISARLNTEYPLYDVHFSVLGTSKTDEIFDGRRLKTGYTNFVATVRIKNPTGLRRAVWRGRFRPVVTNADGETFSTFSLIAATRDEAISTQIAPGGEMRLRFVIPVPSSVPLSSFQIQGAGPSSNAYSLALS